MCKMGETSGCRCDEPSETAANINDQHVIEANRKPMMTLKEIEDQNIRDLIDTRREIEEERIDGPAHYGGKDNPYEAIKIIEAHELGFHLGNSIKYILRAGKKKGLGISLQEAELKDLEKARWYINRRINQITGG